LNRETKRLGSKNSGNNNKFVTMTQHSKMIPMLSKFKIFQRARELISIHLRELMAV
jgi:hypothetical protein